MRKPKYSAQFIADWFVSRAEQDPPSREREALTPRKMSNLMYVAQGIYMALRGHPFFDGEICRGFNGAVIVYDVNGVLHDVVMRKNVGAVSARSKGDNAFLEMVYQEVGKVGSKKLQELIKNSSIYKMVGIGETLSNMNIQLWCESVFLKAS